SRERSARCTTDGPSASAASTRARLVSDLLPGSETSACTGPRACGPGLGSGLLGQLPGLTAYVARRAAGPPGDPGPALGVDAGQQEAAHHREVLEELGPLGRPGRLVLLLPEGMAGVRRGSQRGGEHEGGDARH